MFEYAALKGPNCGSVDTLARMAQRNRPDILYISTISVLEGNETEDCQGVREYIEERAGGYASSKFVAEQRLRRLSEYFGTVTIVRPGLIGYDTRSGSANRSDWFVRFLIGSMQMGGVVCEDQNGIEVVGNIHVTPVDHACTFIMEVLEKRSGLNLILREGGLARGLVKKDNVIQTLHLPLTMITDTSDFLRAYARVASDTSGRLMRFFSLEEWSTLLDGVSRQNALYPFRHQFLNGFEGIPGHSFEKTVQLYPVTIEKNKGKYDDEMMERLVEYLIRREGSLQKKLLLRTLSCKAEEKNSAVLSGSADHKK